MSAAEEENFQRVLDDVRRRQRHVPGPQPIGEVFSRLMARRGFAHVQQSQDCQQALDQAVGGEFAAQCRPGRYLRGVLEVIVANSAVLQEFTFRKRRLLAQLNELLPQYKIRDLRFRIGELD